MPRETRIYATSRFENGKKINKRYPSEIIPRGSQLKDKFVDKKVKKKMAKKRKDVIEHREHLFHTQLVHITTTCEVCNNPIR